MRAAALRAVPDSTPIPQQEFEIRYHAALRAGQRDRLCGYLTISEISGVLEEALLHGKKVARGEDDETVTVHKILLRRVDLRRGYLPYYAIVVEDEPGEQRVVTILTEAQYKRSIRRGRFSTCDMLDLL